jgi:MFS family permease
MEENSKKSADTPASRASKPVRSFLWFITIAYATQGIAQHFCLIAQPLDYFMLKEMGKSAADVAALLSILMVPWMIKPAYGIISDFVPLFGYRRKSYLTLAYALGALFYATAALTNSFSALVAALFLTAVGMAIGTTIVNGLTLQVGRPTSEYRSYQSIQAACYYTANIASFLVGGLLCANFLPGEALRFAALIAAVPCLLTAGAAWKLIDEEKTAARKLDLGTVFGIVREFKMRGLIVVALFLCCWSFSPGFGTPLYFYETKVIGFSQLFIGQLGAINSLGMFCGALVFKYAMDQRISPRFQTVISVLLGAASTIGYLWLLDAQTAIALEFFRGVANIIAILTLYGLASDVSPPRLESTTIAFLIAAYNIAEQMSNVLGAHLYTYTFSEAFAPLIVVSALATLACLVFVPFLPQKDLHAE